MIIKHLHKYTRLAFVAIALLFAVVDGANAYVQTPRSDNADASTRWWQFRGNNEMEVFNYESYGIDNGMTGDNVTVVMRDSEGLMWIGTRDGLNSFDGYDIKTYLPSDFDGDAMIGKDVKGICELPNKDLLIAYADRGVRRFCKSTGRFIKNDKLFDEDIALGIASYGDFVITTTPRYIIVYSKELSLRAKIEIPPIVSSNIPIDRIRIEPILGINNLVAILLSSHTLCILDLYSMTIKNIVCPKYDIFDICANGDGTLFLATSDGVYNYAPKDKEIKQGLVYRGIPIQAFAVDRSGSYWIAYSNNLIARWDTQKNRFITITNCDYILNSQSCVNDILPDNDGILWISTTNKGMVKLDTKTSKISNVVLDAPELPDNYTTYQMSIRNSREVWSAVGRYGVLLSDLQNLTTNLINVDNKYVYSVLTRKNGETYFGTNDGIYKYDYTHHTSKRINLKAVNENEPMPTLVQYMIEDCLGNIWICTPNKFYKYNGNTLKQIQVGDNLKHINTAFEDSDGRIWVGTETGAYYMDPGDTIFNQIPLCSGRDAIDNNALCFSEYKNLVLIGTNTGALVYEKENDNTREARFNSVFRNAKIYDIFTDPNDVTWLSTNTGLGYVSLETAQIYKFDHLDGLKYEGNECRKFSYYKGQMFFGHAKLLNVINTRNVSFNLREPSTFVSEVSYGSSADDVSLQYLNSDTAYIIKYQSNATLRISVASSDFSIPQRNNFQYRVNNGRWVRLPEGSNKFSLADLQPRTYRIDVQTTNCDKVWSVKPTSFIVVIQPPMWRSAMAIVFYLFIIIVITWLVIELRFRGLRKKMTLMENEARAKKTVEAQRNRLVKIHKDLTDSINYAKRIQESIMPREDKVVGLFAKLFVLYKPKDIVSGDFYCFYHRDDKTFLVSADCTGHGVPGAFLSILGIDHLTNIITKQKEDDAGRILTTLHQEMRAIVFKENIDNKEFNEGMDMTICVVDHKSHIINFAGAMNDLYMIRDNEIIVFHGDRHSLGSNTSIESNDMHEYASHNIECHSGDIFYMFSDGYVDQFGGQEQKKFKTRRFKHLLMNIHKLPAKDQKIILNQKHNEWRGNIEQTDDVSIIGFEPWV